MVTLTRVPPAAHAAAKHPAPAVPPLYDACSSVDCMQ
jgi:hypothetical protein